MAVKAARRARSRFFVALVLSGLVPWVAPIGRGHVEAAPASTTVTGTVFHDYTVDGVRQAPPATSFTEVGLESVVVNAYDVTGALVGSASTLSDGTYSLDLSDAVSSDVRIEFVTPDGFQPSFVGTDAGSSVQFVTFPATNVNHALHIPSEYCQSNPQVFASCFYPGNLAYNASLPSLRSTTWTGPTRATPTNMLQKQATGAIFGIGVQRTTGLVYTSAVVRRHSSLGPKGLGGLYVTSKNGSSVLASFDLTASPYNLQLSANLSSYSDASRGITSAQLSLDLPGYAGVGTEGIGDIDVSEDGKYLYLANLYQRSVVRIELTGTAASPQLGAVTHFPVPPTLCNATERPWALKPLPDGSLLVGLSCSDLRSYGGSLTTAQKEELAENAVVAKLVPSGSGTWSAVTTVSFDYGRRTDFCTDTKTLSGGYSLDNCRASRWHPWTNDWASIRATATMDNGDGYNHQVAWPQPIINDIELLDDGSIVVGLGDRLSMQFGRENYQPVATYATDPLQYAWVHGDVLLLCKSGSTYQQESGGDCGSNYDSPRTTEFFGDTIVHNEPVIGGLAVHPSRTDATIAVSVMDPVDINSAGIVWFNQSNGNTNGTGIEIVPKEDFSGSSTFMKATGMGEVEILCDYAPVQIGNRLWIDTDGDGIQDPGEAPAVGVTVRLYDSSGTLVSTAVTNSNGEYLFTSTVTNDPANGGASPDHVGGNLRTGVDYTIRVDNASDFQAGGPLDRYAMTRTDSTTSTVGDLENSIDSDAVMTSGFPRITVPALLPGGNDHTFDIGFVPLVAVGNYTWMDADQDGVQDSDEAPLPGVTVELLDAQGNPALDSYGVPVPAQTTDANGAYLFDNLAPGEYRVKFTQPTGYVFTRALAPGSASGVDSNADAASGLTDVFSVAGMSAGDTSTDTDPNTAARFVNPTIDAGFVPLVGIGDSVWVDADRDGVRDAGEAPLEGVTVELLDENGDPARDALGNLVAPATTDANGNYFFDDLLPGNYRTRFTAPPNYVATGTNVDGATSALDSDADRTTGLTEVFAVSPTVTGDTTADSDPATRARLANRTINAGFVPMVSVGDFVWFDLDRDGVQDDGERGIAGVTLSITNADGTAVTDVFGNPVTTTTTDANGNYLFENLPVGQYTVSVTPPEGMIPTVAGSGTAATDSSNGTATSSNLLTNGASDMTLDFGFVVPRVSVGDYVWYDIDNDGVQERNEPPLAGVELRITKADGSAVTDVFGNPMTTTVTDVNGKYSFDNLPPGQYTLTVTDPAGFEPTVANKGSGDTDSSTRKATSMSLTEDGSRDPSLDFGFWAPPAVVGSRVWNDLNRDGLQDIDEPGVGGVTLTLTLEDGSPVRDLDGDLVPPTVTDAHGNYLFSNLPLGQVYRVTITYPDGTKATLKTQGPDRENDSSTNTATSAKMTLSRRADLSLDFGLVFDDVVASGCPCPEPAPVDESTPLVVDQRRLLKTGQPGWLNPFILATPSNGAKWVESSTRLWNPKTKSWTTSVTTKQGTWSVIRGQVKFTPADGFKGLASLPFAVTDTAGKTAMADLYVAVDAELPRTGTNTNHTTNMAVVFCATGLMLLLVRRRRIVG